MIDSKKNIHVTSNTVSLFDPFITSTPVCSCAFFKVVIYRRYNFYVISEWFLGSPFENGGWMSLSISKLLNNKNALAECFPGWFGAFQMYFISYTVHLSHNVSYYYAKMQWLPRFPFVSEAFQDDTVILFLLNCSVISLKQK